MSEVIAKAKTTTTPRVYREFFKRYYKEKFKVFSMVANVISICLIVAGLVMYFFKSANVLGVTLIVAGIVLVIYPSLAYRRPYKEVKDQKITATFEFFEEKMTEKSNISKDSYKYKSIRKVWETPEYFYIFHSKEKASVIDKDKFSEGSAEAVADLLKNNVEKYELKNK